LRNLTGVKLAANVSVRKALARHIKEHIHWRNPTSVKHVANISVRKAISRHMKELIH